MFLFYTSWKDQKAKHFLVFSEGVNEIIDQKSVKSNVDLQP